MKPKGERNLYYVQHTCHFSDAHSAVTSVLTYCLKGPTPATLHDPGS